LLPVPVDQVTNGTLRKADRKTLSITAGGLNKAHETDEKSKVRVSAFPPKGNLLIPPRPR